jgi:hypothetical protein
LNLPPEQEPCQVQTCDQGENGAGKGQVLACAHIVLRFYLVVELSKVLSPMPPQSNKTSVSPPVAILLAISLIDRAELVPTFGSFRHQ